MNYSEFKRNIFFRFNCIIFFIFFTFSLAAQNKAASSVQVDNLSDDQVKEVAKKVESSGLTQQQAEAAAQAKGMKPEEIQKLKDRVNNLNKNDQKTAVEQNKETTRQTEEKTDLTNKIEGSTINALNQRIFGYSLFNTKNLTFEPGLNLPTPQNYQIGPGDQIIIDIWGASQAYYKLTVNPEGTIIIDNVGPVFINGLSIESASKKVLARLSSIYAGLTGSNPNTFAQVSLGNMRSIKVTIIGEIRLPGTYTLPSLATVFNALYVSGRPG